MKKWNLIFDVALRAGCREQELEVDRDSWPGEIRLEALAGAHRP